MRVRASLLLVMPVLGLMPAGCQRLNDERAIHVPAGGIQPILYSAPTYAQKLTIHVSSPGAPITVCLVREEDREAAEAALDKDKTPTSTLAGMAKGEDINLEATVPAKTAYALLIRADRKAADVQIQVNGR
jgi:hypothetical protein